MSRASRESGGISRTRNVLTNWGTYVTSAVINFFLSPFVVHSLGDASYGIWALLGSLVGYLGLLDLGVRGAVTRYIAKSHSQENHLEATRVASSALAIFTVVGLLAITVSLGLALVISRIFQIPEEFVNVARFVVILGGINVAVSFVGGVYGGVVVGLQRFDYANAVEFTVQILRVLAIVLALRAGFGLLALAAIQLGMTLLRGLASYALSRRLYPQLRASFRECRKPQVMMIFTFSISVLLLQAFGMVILQTDSMVIGASLPVSMITFFAIAANLVEYARGPISAISHTVTPWASALEARSEPRKLQELLLAASRISTLVALPIVLTFLLRGHTFIGLWMGPEYAQPSGDVLWILSLALWFAVGYQVVVASMMGISKHGGLVYGFLVEAVCNIVLSLIWVRSYGIVGVAWGTTVPRLFASIFFAPWYARRVLGTSIRGFWIDVWVRPALAMALFAGGTYVVERWWEATNLFVYFSQVALVLPLAAAGAWVVSLSREEKNRVLSSGLLGRRGR